MSEAKTKTTTRRKAGSGKATASGQTQSKAAPAAKPKAKRAAGSRRPGTTAGKALTQGQELGVGGTREVPIVVTEVPDKSYTQRAMKPEEFPFSQLTPAVKKDKAIIGPSFFIPEDENPDRLIATARKRLRKDVPFGIYWSRKTTEKGVAGKRVWRASKEAEADAAKAKQAGK